MVHTKISDLNVGHKKVNVTETARILNLLDEKNKMIELQFLKLGQTLSTMTSLKQGSNWCRKVRHVLSFNRNVKQISV